MTAHWARGIRYGAAVAVATAWAARARAEPRRLDVGVFVGADRFGDDIELGNAWAPEQVPGTSFLFGLRAGTPVISGVVGGTAVSVGAEAEMKLATAFTGTAGERASYFAPVVGWRAQAIARLDFRHGVAPHLVIGVGGESITSGSPFVAGDTDLAVYWGLGAAGRVAPRWQLRLDLRHGLTAGRMEAVASTFELHLGVERAFDFGTDERTPPVPPDQDGDGIPDASDRCPAQIEDVDGFDDGDGCPDLDDDGDGVPDISDDCRVDAEDRDGFDDGDGCPEPDNDGDGLDDGADRCPIDAEDLDHFEDGDGCPDLDNDGDGLEDRADICPEAAERWNGIVDDDGCPDELPPELARVTGPIGIGFEPGRAKLWRSAAAFLDGVAAALRKHRAVRVHVIGHAHSSHVWDVALAARRADAVRWYLVDQGVAADRITTEGRAGDGTAQRVIEIVVVEGKR